MRINSVRNLRSHGETYTPDYIVESMLDLVVSKRMPSRIVDCGCGSGRFSIASASRFPDAQIIAIDSSPIATIMCKCNIAVLDLERKVEVVLGDFTNSRVLNENVKGATLWIGNPPYVRHHELSEAKKKWLAKESSKLGMHSSGLSGLHAYFFLAIAKRYRNQDYGVLVTSAEWLDVKYGQLIRDLLLKKLGLKKIYLADQTNPLFEGINTTTVITYFDAENLGGDVEFSSYKSLESSGCVTTGARAMACEKKWSNFFSQPSSVCRPEGFVRLGDFARVHRGIVTGANKFWIVNSDDGKSALSVPIVTHAREIIGIGNSLTNIGSLSRLITLPLDLDTLNYEDKKYALEIIKRGKKECIDRGYVASSRRCWWSISINEPAPILMTYMARHSPVFVANPKQVRSLNVVHGIYPSVELSEHAINDLVAYLNNYVKVSSGRTYSGGLTKFEPKEVEALFVPSPEMLEEGTWRF